MNPLWCVEWLKWYSADNETSRCICWNLREPVSEILVFDLEQQTQSSLLCLSSCFCDVKHFEFLSQFWVSVTYSTDGPLKGGGDALWWDVFCERLHVCVHEMCVWVRLPLLLNLELHHAPLFVCSSETKIEFNALCEITVRHTREGTQNHICRKQTDSELDTQLNTMKYTLSHTVKSMSTHIKILLHTRF